ncbi:MAG: diguanylate cyclase [Spirochaetaceae bacterium]|nr:MAG: diguanylate cyclase [Spirochaetaceae bacterium]
MYGGIVSKTLPAICAFLLFLGGGVVPLHAAGTNEGALAISGGVLSLAGQDLSRPRPVRGVWKVQVGPPVADTEPLLVTVPPRERRYFTPWGERLVTGTITYRARITDVPTTSPLALEIPLVFGTLRAWVNGREVVAIGQADVPERSRVERRVLVPLLPGTVGGSPGDELDVEICIGSSYYPYGGMTHIPPRLGTLAALQRSRTVLAFRDGVLIGFVLLVAMYHFLLVFAPNKDATHLFIAVFAAALAYRFAVADGEMFLGAFLGLSAEAMLRLQGPAVYVLTPLYILFLRQLLPSESTHRAFRVILRVSAVWVVAAIFIPLRFWMDLLFWYYPIIIAASLSIGITILRAVRAGRDGARLIAAGGLVLLTTGIVRIFSLLGFYVPPAYCHALGGTVFLLANSIALSRRMVDFRLSLANLREEAQRDGLTGLFNRRTFDTRLQEEWQRHVRSSQPLALMMADVDYFKRYNDALGHQEGDEALRIVAGVLQQHAQRAGDFVARYGGEEFVLVLPNTEIAGAYQLAESIRRLVREKEIPHPESPERLLTISIGVSAVIPEQGTAGARRDPRDLVKAADRALYDAKLGGRDATRTAPLGE